MEKSHVFVHSNSSLICIFEFLTQGENICISDYIPVTLDNENKTMIGVIKIENLINYLRKETMINSVDNSVYSTWSNLISVLLQIYSELDEEVKISI